MKLFNVLKIRYSNNRFPIVEYLCSKNNKDNKKKLEEKEIRNALEKFKKLELAIKARKAEYLCSKNNVDEKKPLKRKKTIDPQDTKEANKIQFKISGEVDDFTEKLEEYQEKMRKTQGQTPRYIYSFYYHKSKHSKSFL